MAYKPVMAHTFVPVMAHKPVMAHTYTYMYIVHCYLRMYNYTRIYLELIILRHRYIDLLHTCTLLCIPGTESNHSMTTGLGGWRAIRLWGVHPQ